MNGALREKDGSVTRRTRSSRVCSTKAKSEWVSGVPGPCAQTFAYINIYIYIPVDAPAEGTTYMTALASSPSLATFAESVIWNQSPWCWRERGARGAVRGR